jgi:hypothetical protein
LVNGPAVQFSQTETPETYIGSERQERFASPENAVDIKVRHYSIPDTLSLHYFAVSGLWSFDREYATVSSVGATLRLHFRAKDVYLVMTSDKPVPVTVNLLEPTQKNQSEDLDSSGQVTVDASRLYHLVHLDAAVDGTVELQFTQPGIRVYAFTFGS